MALRIRDWDKHFESAASRKLKRLEWIAIPNKTEGEGYMALVDHPDGAAHLGAWYAIVECASRQKIRGNLPPGLSRIDGGICQDISGICRAIGKISQLPSAVFEAVIPRLLQIGWIEEFECEVQDTRAQDRPSNGVQPTENKQPPTLSGNSATSLGNSANVVAEKTSHIEGNGITGNGITATAHANGNVPKLQSEYPQTLAAIRDHDAAADPLFCIRIADTVCQAILSDPKAQQWPPGKAEKAISDPILAKAVRESYATPRKAPHGTGLLLSTVPKIILGGKTNYV